MAPFQRRTLARRLLLAGAVLVASGLIYGLTLVLWVHLRPAMWVRYTIETHPDGTVSPQVTEVTDEVAYRLVWVAPDGTVDEFITGGGIGRDGSRWGYSSESSSGFTMGFPAVTPVATPGRWVPLNVGDEVTLAAVTARPDGPEPAGTVRRLVVRCEGTHKVGVGGGDVPPRGRPR